MKRKIGHIIGVILAVLTIAVLLSIAVLKIYRYRNVVETGNVLGVSWYSETDSEFTITTLDELYEFAALSDFYDFKGQTIKLGADIVVNEGNATDWEEKAPEKLWRPITGFAGTFDGQGHSICGVYGKGLETPMALFIYTDYGCSIQNFKLVNSYFETRGNSGTASIACNGGGKFVKIYSDAIMNCEGENCAGIASVINGQTTLDECWYDGSITITNRDCGGIVDDIQGVRVNLRHCLFSGSITSTYGYGGTRTGGICGRVEEESSVIMSDCLASGTITAANEVYTGSIIGTTYTGAILSINDTYTSTDTYASIIGANGQNGEFTGQPMNLRKTDMIGMKAYQWSTLDFENYWAVVEGSTPILKYFAEEVPSLTGIEKAYDLSWYNKNNSVYTISNLKQLYGLSIISSMETFQDKRILLDADIVVNEGNASDWAEKAPENPWYPIQYFCGAFDGQGHTISGIYLDSTEQNSGFIRTTAFSSYIHDLKLVNSYFNNSTTGNAMLGSIVGRGGGKIDSVYSDAILNCSGSLCGGIIGQVNLDKENKITNCWFDGEIHMKTNTGRYAGGIAGNIVKGNNLVEHCLNTGFITVEAMNVGLHVGGLIGTVYNTGTTVVMNDCLNTGELKATHETCIGAVFGRLPAEPTVTIKNTYATSESYVHPLNGFMGIGTVSAGKQTGNVVDYTKKDITGYGAYQWTTLDFDDYWAIEINGTPILKSFANTIPSLAGIEKKYDISWYKEDAKAYVIDSVKDLYGLYIVSIGTDLKGKTVQLGADIVLNSGNAEDWAVNAPENQWHSIGKFAGTFDGQGHTISGLYLKKNGSKIGLFSETTSEAVVKNLRLTNSYLEGNATGDVKLGSIAGVGNGTFDTIYSNAIVTTSGLMSGGLVGQINAEGKNKITNCWFDGKLMLTTNTGRYGGGIVGMVENGTNTIEHCLNTGAISAEAVNTGVHASGVVAAVRGKATICNISDCLNAGIVTAAYDTRVGSVIGGSLEGVINLSETYTTTESYKRAIGTLPTGTINGNVIQQKEVFYTGVNAYRLMGLNYEKYWSVIENHTPELKSFTTRTVLSTEGVVKADTAWYDANPKAEKFTIDTAEELYGFAFLSQFQNFLGQTVELGKDITVNNGEASDWAKKAPINEWMPIGNSNVRFAGVFDGNEHSISGIYLNATNEMSGLFSQIGNSTTIKRLKLTNSYFTSTKSYFGSIAGFCAGNIEEVYSDAIVTSSASECGGLVGRFGTIYTATIRNSWFAGSVTSDAQDCGGIVGRIHMGNKTIENCLNTGNITSTYSKDTLVYAGGLVGREYCDVSGQTVTLTMRDCLNAGNVKVKVGGGVGSVMGRARNEVAFANVYFKENTLSCTNGTIGTEWTVPGVGDYTTLGNAVSGAPVEKTETQLKGANARYNTGFDYYTGVEDDGVWVAQEGGYPALKALVDSKTYYTEDVTMTADTSWYDPNDVKQTYYISTAAELGGLAELSHSNNFTGTTFKITADITLNLGNASDWSASNRPLNSWNPIGVESKSFDGIFDGQGHTINGLYLNATTNVSGMFGRTGGNSNVTNFRLVNSYITSTKWITGGIVGFANGNIGKIYCSALVNSSEQDCGGIVGRFGSTTTATISECQFDGIVTSSARYCGGIVGNINLGNKTLSKCLNTGTVISTLSPAKDQTPFVGGLFGTCIQSGTTVIIENCLQAGEVSSLSQYATGSVTGRVREATSFTLANVYTTNNCYYTDASGVKKTPDITWTDYIGIGNASSVKPTNAPILKTKEEAEELIQNWFK